MSQVSKPIVSAYLATNEPEHLSATRAIIVFGKNSATYKFALLDVSLVAPSPNAPVVTQLKVSCPGEIQNPIRRTSGDL